MYVFADAIDRLGLVLRPRELRQICDGGRRADGGSTTLVPHQRAQDRFPNWLSSFCALSHHRSRRCRGVDVDGDDDVVADAYFAALQAHAVRADRWLDSYHRHISVEFLGDQ